MKKICLTVVGLYILLIHAFAQVATKDTAEYKAKPLAIEEINLVTSYYSQTGNHSPVTGGIGTEKVTDLANMFELKLVGHSAGYTKHTLVAGLGVDHHTAASAAYVNKSGASSQDGTRIYPSLNWTAENEKRGSEFGLGTYYSTEYNYKSFAFDAHYSKKITNNSEVSLKASAYLDQVKLIYPSELIPTSTTTTGTVYYTTASGRTTSLSGGNSKSSIPTSPRNTFTGSLSFSQVINKRLQAAVFLDAIAQNGYLGLPFHRVYFTDGTEKVENLPSTRTKIPVGVRLNYFAGDKVIFRTYYRYYTDDWGLSAHTASIEVPYKFSSFFSVSPFFRYYSQSASKYFAPYATHKTTDQYFTSNYSQSTFNSSFFGAGVRIAPPKGLFNSHLSSLEIRYGHYAQTTDLLSDVLSFEFKFK